MGIIIMKFKSIIIIGLLFLSLLCVTTVYADTVEYDNSTFTIPEGYTIVERDNQLVMYDNDSVITLYSGEIISIEDARRNRINSGLTLLDESTYNLNDVRINQQNYSKDGMICCTYTFRKNNKDYIISYITYEDYRRPLNEPNPVSMIIQSLK